MSELNRETEFMPLLNPMLRVFLILTIAVSMFLGGCSYIPWVKNDEDDLAFEEDFPFEDDEQTSLEGEDDFFEDDGGNAGDEFALDGDEFALDEDDDFASVDQRTDKNELKGDVGTLQNQRNPRTIGGKPFSRIRAIRIPRAGS